MTSDPPTSVAVLDPKAPEAELADVLAAASDHLPGVQVTRGDGWMVVPIGDGTRSVSIDAVERLPAVRRVVPVSAPYRLASREVFGANVGFEAALVDGGRGGESIRLGGDASVSVIVSSRWVSGSEAKLALLAPLLHEAGCRIFHAGQMALPSSRDSTAGLAADAIGRLRDVAHVNGLALCVEVSDASQITSTLGLADVLQVGSQNMQDFSLLREMGRSERPVLLRRGAGATVEEFLLAAEYILVHGNGRVILCESGIRTFDALRKPRFEINAVPLIRQLSHLPLVADASLTAPQPAVVPAMAKAAVAAGADGLVLEVGPEAIRDPDGVAIQLDSLRGLVAELRPIALAVGRSMDTFVLDRGSLPVDAAAILRLTDRTLGQTIEAITGSNPTLEVVGQWELATPDSSWLSPPLSSDARVLARCTSYRMGSVRLSRNLSYVDLGRIDTTLGALLREEHLNLGQLFVNPRIEKLDLEFGTQQNAKEIDGVFRRWFPDERDELHPYVWRRYRAAIEGVVTFVVIEALPVHVWERLLSSGWTPPPDGGGGA